jgi:hypothetical protein
MTAREHFTDANNTVLALLLDEEMFSPIVVEAADSNAPKQYLRDIFDDSYEDMKADLLMQVEALPDLRTGLNPVLDAVMDVAGILSEDRDRVRTALRRLVATMRATREPAVMKAIRGMDVSVMRTKAGFDKVVESLQLNEICIHTTRPMTAETMIEYRAGIASINSMSQKTLAETISLAEKLTEDNGGLLPSYTQLRTARYHGIVLAMHRYPEAFAHIGQIKKQKTLAETVALAEKLTKENGGLLPTSTWLDKNKYGSVRSALTLYPEAFAHIERERKNRKQKTLAETVALAEKLTKENGGLLPTHRWLRAEGHTCITSSLYTHPEAFAHLLRRLP